MTSSATSGRHLLVRPKVAKALLICGIIAPLVWIGTDLLAGTLYAGYSFTSQAISELFAIGAPTSGLVVPLFTLYDVLLVAFALGFWVSTDRRRAERVMALMVIGNAINGLVLWNFFPMHMRGTEATFTDTMHIVLAVTGVSLAIAAIGLGVTAFRNWFRLYSIGTILILIVPAILGFMYAPQVGANQPTQWLGLTERISTLGYLQWQVVLAIVLLRGQKALGVSSHSLHYRFF